MLQYRDDEHEDEFDDVHANDVSSDEDTYYQTVAVGGRQGKLDCAGGGTTAWQEHLFLCKAGSSRYITVHHGTSLMSEPRRSPRI